jgi:DNA-directed RNA polymerase specialized sigma subunit, sigma24 homolog
MQLDLLEEFLQLLRENLRQIYSCFFVFVLNKADADDMIQETNLVLWREFMHFKSGTNFLA